jgi:hypothetical protein
VASLISCVHRCGSVKNENEGEDEMKMRMRMEVSRVSVVREER